MGLTFSVGSAAGVAMTEMMNRLAAAETKANDAAAKAAHATTMATTATEVSSGVQAGLAATESNVTTLAGLAADYQSQLGASIADRAALHASINTMAADLAALTNEAVGIGVTTTPLLALAANGDVVVPLSRTMPNLDYTMDWATSLPRTSYLVTEKARTTSSITLNLKAALAVGVGTIVVLVRG